MDESSLKQSAKVPALRVSELLKTYKNGVKALHGISLEVEQGDFFALLGPNGAGKSTLIGIVSSLIQKTSGTVEVFGHNLEKDPTAAKSSLGLVPQEFNFSMFETVLQIVVNQAGYYGVERAEAIQRAEAILRQLDLWEKRDQASRNLSGGMKRRLMIARALIHRPKLLILDEPTAGVDIELRRSMWTFLCEINKQGTTIILTTHYLEEAESLCRNIAIIDHGKIIENTGMKQLLRQLDQETFVLDLSSPLSIAPQIEGIVCRLLDETTLEIDVPTKDNLNRYFLSLSDQGIQVVSMKNRANRLEELFVRLVKHPQRNADHA